MPRPANPDEFPPLVYVDLIRDEPMTQGQFLAAHNLHFGASEYSAYINKFQPWRSVILRDGNFEPLFVSSERYFNRSDALAAITLAFSATTTVFLREAEHGNVLVRRAAPPA